MAMISMSQSCVCSTEKDHLFKPSSPKPQSFSQTHHSISLFSPPQTTRIAGISRNMTHITSAQKGISSRTRRLEKRGKKGVLTTSPLQDEEKEGEEDGVSSLNGGLVGGSEIEGSLGPMPVLPGENPDFWEGPQWDALGFFVQYLWAFGIVFALIACGIAVATYNEGATDFKQTPVFKESIQSRDLLEEPEASNSDVFEANPTEEAPSLE